MTRPHEGGDVDAGLISRGSFSAAFVLGLLGLLRLASDMLTDVNPSWSAALAGTPYRYLVRGATDGTLLGNLNVQYFKLLAIPCGVSVAFFINLVVAGSLEGAQARWRPRSARAAAVGSLLLVCTLIELEKEHHWLGLGFGGLLAGEEVWINHTLHLVGAVFAWLLMSRLRYPGGQHGPRGARRPPGGRLRKL